MSWDIADRLGFDAAMIYAAHQFDKELRKAEEHERHRESFNIIAEGVSAAVDRTGGIIQRAIKVSAPTWSINGVLYMPLFCFGSVLRRQRRITPDQRKVLSSFNNMSFPFTTKQFADAMIWGKQIGDYNDLMDLDQQHSGRFWLYLCQAFYTAGTPEEFQEFVNGISNTMMHFSVLGNSESTIGIDCCSEFVESVNNLMENLIDRSEGEIDSLGVIPMPVHMRKLRRLFDEILAGSDIEASASSDPNSYDNPKSLIDVLLFHSLCNIAMMTQQPKEAKIQMIWDGLNLLGVKPILAPEDYIREVANRTGIGGAYRQMFACEEGAGLFWSMINRLCVEGGRQSAPFMQELGSILTQVEDNLSEKYQGFGEGSIASNYLKYILDYMMDDLNAHLPTGG